MLAEQEQRKREMQGFDYDDEISIGGAMDQPGFDDDDDDFNLDSLFADVGEDALDGLFGGDEEEKEKLDSDGLDSLLDALSSDVDDDDDIDLFDDNDDEDEEE